MVLVLEPGDDFEPGGQPPDLFGAIRRRLEGYRGPFAYLFLASALLAVAGLVIPTLSRIFVDDVLIESTTGLKRTLHPIEKHPRNPILEATMPWETPCRYFLPFGVIREAPDAKFRAWYG